MNINNKLAEYHRENIMGIKKKNKDNSSNTNLLNEEEKIERDFDVIKDTPPHQFNKSQTEQINSNLSSKKDYSTD